jgi:hypothetical protein
MSRFKFDLAIGRPWGQFDEIEIYVNAEDEEAGERLAHTEAARLDGNEPRSFIKTLWVGEAWEEDTDDPDYEALQAA